MGTIRPYREASQPTNHDAPEEKIPGFGAFLAEQSARERLLRVAGRILPVHDAEDALHDGVVQALSSASSFRGDARLSTWMHQVTVNAALMRIRRSKRETRHSDEARHAAPFAPWVVAGSEAKSPNEMLEQAEATHALRDAIAALPAHYREVLERCVLDERAPDDVAAELGLTPSALRTRLGRGRRLLAASLSPASAPA